MALKGDVHLIDSDSRRRAAIAFKLHKRNIHTEIYEDLIEFVDRFPTNGVVLANDNSQAGEALELLEVINRKGNLLPVAMFATCPSPERIVRAMSSGAYSYLEWPFPIDKVERTISEILERSTERLQRARKMAAARTAVSRLSRREFDVLRLLVDGASNKEMARNLGISSRTVEIHRGNLLSKLNAASSADAVRIGIYAGVDEIE